MYFRLLHDEASGALSYLLADLAAGEAVLIDPRAADLPLLQAMLAEHRLRLRWLLQTHEHAAQRPQQQRRALAALGAPLLPRDAPLPALLPFGDDYLQPLDTPGHTAACRSWRWRDRLFCGGLLAVDACPYQPRPALPQALWDSVTTQVFTLPGETLLFSGHAGGGGWVASTVHEQRRRHPWFGDARRDDFLARVATPAPSTSHSPPAPEPRHEHHPA